MVSIFKRGNKLYLQFIVDGKKRQKSTGLTDTPANRKLLKKEVIPAFEAKLVTGEYNKPKAKPFEYYGDIWLRSKENLKSYMEWHNIYLHQLLPVFGKKKIDAISRGEIKEFVDKKLQVVSPKRVRTLINCIKAIFDIAIDYEHISTNPAVAIKLPRHTPIEMMPFSKEEVETLLNNADGWFKNYLAVAFYTGARHGEIIALQWSDIDFHNLTININKRIKKGKVDTPKTKSSIRKVPILKPLLPYLQDQFQLCQEAKSMSVFFNPHTNRPFLDTKKLAQFWKPLLEKCGFEYRRFYNTRHTFVTQMIRAGVPILDISQTVGHKSIDETIRTYAKYMPQEHLKIDRNFDPFACNLADSSAGDTVISR
ncbi:phage integrase [Nitratiruptor phage NrS-5]|uniref:site-specific integrase n=1 Tax=unclassified Nitratiruptor TaxID=2624044 RepID=UPI001915BB82|nr:MULTISPECIES: site-specific integrase [unclassified Nitratiruptor]BCD61705.1 phage integrase [Nitratiruptor sp. YY08-13]BCD65640.1 phage integrase [Nitratiruptor sp. YY08-26]BCD83183.1 phage integrase [Nitratiruptor phage NrS-4]BCD83242.1 phage integrase [Nitratiruptor phage NrS-5]